MLRLFLAMLLLASAGCASTRSSLAVIVEQRPHDDRPAIRVELRTYDR